MPIPAYGLRDNPRATLTITRKTFRQIEEFIEDNKASARRVNEGMDFLIRMVALSVKAGAQSRAMGPVAPRKRSRPELAYRIPVQRITGAYFAGWHLRRIRSGHWLLYNNFIESYLIETGLYMRVRRPILKMSIIDMLRMLQTTRTGEAFVDWIIAPRRDAKGRFQSFKSRMSGSAVLSQAGPQGKLPG